MRPPRLRCTLFPLIYPPHLLGSYKRQLYGFVLFGRLTKRNLASYVISVRRTKSLLTASFRFYLTIDTLAVQLYTSLSPRRVRDFHPLERAHGAQTKICPGIMIIPGHFSHKRDSNNLESLFLFIIQLWTYIIQRVHIISTYSHTKMKMCTGRNTCRTYGCDCLTL